jgi:wyosine [tRNA(Phe)-imidazoG37] synthetase (radical SAM superfamily)
MSTFLFNEIIFGPVASRRLGVSLGVNLLPVDCKVCNFNCVYCECGWTEPSAKDWNLPTRELVKQELREKLTSMKSEGKLPDVITFAGNGEPSLHPEFAGIIDDTIAIRDSICPGTRVAVLSNATLVNDPSTQAALLKADQNILKLDSGISETINLVNQPESPVDVEEIIEGLKQFEGKLIIQTLFIRGSFQGKRIDNTSESEITAWLLALQRAGAKEAMIYSIHRSTPLDSLEKVPTEELEAIAERARKEGIEVLVTP